jgi:hypothetical protein
MAFRPRIPLYSNMTERTERVESLAPWAAGLLLASPVLVAFYPPMTDLAYHEAAIGILRHFHDESMFPPGLYVRNFGEPNQLFHLLGWALSYVVSTRWAVKLVIAAVIVAIPVCAARFARHVGASPLAAIVVAPMALGWLFSWGLIANLLGLAAFLFLLPVLDRFAYAPTWRRALAACGGLVLLYLAHEAMMFLYAGVALALALLHSWSWRKTAWRLTPFLGGILLTIGHVKLQARFMTPLVRQLPRIWDPILHKLAQAPYILFPAREGVVQLAMSVLCALAIGSFFWMRARERTTAPGDHAPLASRFDRLRARVLRYRWEAFAVACFAAYLAFPLTLSGATLIYQRWFPPAFAMLAVVAAPRDLSTRAARVPLIALIALPLATLFVALPSFVDSNREYEALEQIIPSVDLGSAVVELNLGPGEDSRTYSLGPAAGRILATRGGRLAYAFTDSPISPVVIPRRYQWTESLARIAFSCWMFRPAHDVKRFRYILLRTTDEITTKLLTWALQEEAEYVTEAGEWALFRARSPVVPLLSRDVPMEKPPPESLRDRFLALLARMKPPSEDGAPPEAKLPSEGAASPEASGPPAAP